MRDLGPDISVEKTVSGTWMVLINGLQWAPMGQPRDLSGAGSAEFPTRREAIAAFIADEELMEERLREAGW